MKKIIFIILVLIVFVCIMLSQKYYSNFDYENEVKNVYIWHPWAAEKYSKKTVLEDILNSYENLYHNVNFKVESYYNETYKTKIKIATATNELPDIFFTWGSGFIEEALLINRVLPINEYLSKDTLKKINNDQLSNFTFNNKIYGLPMYQWIALLYCNKDLFHKYNIKIPDTYEELLIAIEQFNQNSIIPISVSGKDKWSLTYFHNILSIRTAGTDLCAQALDNNKTFNQQKFKVSADCITELLNLGAFEDNFLKCSFDEAENDFEEERSAMYFMGNWAASKWEGNNSKIMDKILCINFPSMSNTNISQTTYIGGPIDTFMIDKKSKYKKELVKIVEYISENMSEQSLIYGYGVPSWKTSLDESKISPLSNEINKIISNSSSSFISWDTYLINYKANLYKDLVYDLFEKKINSDEFIKKMDTIHQKNY